MFLETSRKEKQLIETEGRRLNVSGVLKILRVSRSGYNYWKHKTPTEKQRKKEELKDRIREIHEESYKNYGAPKITKALHIENNKIAEKTVGKYMKEMGIRAQYIKPYTVTTIDSNFSDELKNLLNEQFNPDEPNAVWCSDITYIWTMEGFVYLTSVMDLFSRKIISWVLSTTLEAKWVVQAINKAKKVRKITKPLVMHTDRGIQYVCNEYKQAIEGFVASYSKKAYPWDNACIESFHALLKREWINRYRVIDYNHAYKLIFEYIETFYNTIRIHSHCDYISPNKYEQMYELKSKKYKKSS